MSKNIPDSWLHRIANLIWNILSMMMAFGVFFAGIVGAILFLGRRK